MSVRPYPLTPPPPAARSPRRVITQADTGKNSCRRPARVVDVDQPGQPVTATPQRPGDASLADEPVADEAPSAGLPAMSVRDRRPAGQRRRVVAAWQPGRRTQHRGDHPCRPRAASSRAREVSGGRARPGQQPPDRQSAAPRAGSVRAWLNRRSGRWQSPPPLLGADEATSSR